MANTPSAPALILLSNVRLSFPHIIEPQRTVDAVTGKERIAYNCDLILEPTNPGLAQFMKACGEIALAKWGENVNAVMTMINNDRKVRCYGRGEEKVNKKTFKPYDGYVGGIYISCSRDSQPQIIQADGTPIDQTNSMAYNQLTRKMYGGCRVNAAVKPWIQSNKFGNGIRCELIALQFAGDDEAFGEGSADASGLFGAVAVPQQSTPSFMQQPAAAAPAMPASPFPSFLG